MTETSPANEAPHDSVVPRDAASIVVFDIVDGDLRVLMGQRGAGQAFMPNRFVFPGGRVDATDREIVTGCGGLAEIQQRLLAARTSEPTDPQRLRSLPIAAVRETFEEAGLVLGVGEPAGQAIPPDLPSIWQRFAEHAGAPAVGNLTFFARAITPPGRTRRYDTRFFCIERAGVLTETDQTDGELSNLDWYSVSRLTDLNLAPITQRILGDFSAWKRAQSDNGHGAYEVPFYHQDEGVFRRDVLSPLCPQDG